MKKEMYNALAPFYAALNGDVDYEGMADFVTRMVKTYYPKKTEDILDLGCGSGNMTLPLLHRGFGMVGVDFSEDMLAAARDREDGDKVLWLCQDMRSFELYGTVEAAVCSLDGLNHLTKKKDLYACLSLVHNYLVPDGLFIFDINSPYKFQHVYGDRCYILEEDGVFCAWQNDFSPKSGLCRFYLTLFTENGNGYDREDVMTAERMYTPKTMKKALRDTGFALLGIFDGYTEQVPNDHTERLTFIAKAIKNEK